MTTSPNLALPYLAAAQAQKHVTLNESLRRLDALVQLSAVSATLATQPTSPADGDVYILPPGKTGTAWGPMANGALAYYRDGAWEAITPREGWLAWVRDQNLFLFFDGAAWSGNYYLQGVVTIAGTIPNLRFFDSDGATNQKYSAFRIDSGNFVLQTRDDAFSTAENFFDVRRSGTSIMRVSLLCGAVQLMVEPTGVFPGVDAATSLGLATRRWSQVFSSTGAIQTSDAREKTALAPLGEALLRAAARIKAGVGVFQWLEAVAAKGPEGARLHVGVTAQAVREAFLAEGLSPSRYGLFCEDPVIEVIEHAAVEEVNPATLEVRTITPARTEVRPILNPDGSQATRLGVRTDQLALLLLAAG